MAEHSGSDGTPGPGGVGDEAAGRRRENVPAAPGSAPAGVEGARERRVRTPDGVELCVAELGDPERPTVVLLHGYPDSKEVWSKVAGQLAGRFHVVLYDVRGCGRSSAPQPLRGGFTLEKLTADFLAVADEVAPGRPVHLAGHDWGSVQGWEFATADRTRGRVASFTSMCGPSLDHLGHWFARQVRRPAPAALARALGQGVRSWYVAALHTPALPEAAWRGPLSAHWPRYLRRVEKVPDDGYPTASLARDAANGAWLYRDNVRPRLRRPRPGVRAHTPVQLVVPQRDVFLSRRVYDEAALREPGLVRRTVDAGHWLPRTRPDLLAVWIADFVTRAEAGPAEAARPEAAPPAAARSLRSGSGPGSPAGRGGTARERYEERFCGQLVLVTGAGSGIGRATALAFAAAGARIVSVDVNGTAAAHTAELARKAGAPQARSETADVGDRTAMEALAARTAAELGVVDVLVNNAGIGIAGPFLDTTVEEWQRTLDVNLWGVIHGCRLFGGQMAERGQGGHIVNVASDAAYQPTRLLPAYGASKAAVLMLSECLRAELAGQGIGVTAVCPGPVTTGITATARFAGLGEEEQQRRRARVAKLYGLRNYPPEKVAGAVLRSVVRNDAVVPVTPEAHAARFLSRVAPRVLRALARIDPPLGK